MRVLRYFIHRRPVTGDSMPGQNYVSVAIILAILAVAAFFALTELLSYIR